MDASWLGFSDPSHASGLHPHYSAVQSIIPYSETARYDALGCGNDGSGVHRLSVGCYGLCIRLHFVNRLKRHWKQWARKHGELAIRSSFHSHQSDDDYEFCVRIAGTRVLKLWHCARCAAPACRFWRGYVALVVTDFTTVCNGFSGAGANSLQALTSPGIYDLYGRASGAFLGTLTISAVPEPTSLSMLGLGLLGVLGMGPRGKMPIGSR